jgi:hypothetical protein
VSPDLFGGVGDVMSVHSIGPVLSFSLPWDEISERNVSVKPVEGILPFAGDKAALTTHHPCWRQGMSVWPFCHLMPSVRLTEHNLLMPQDQANKKPCDAWLGLEQ